MAFERLLEESELWIGEMRQLRHQGRPVLLLRTEAGVFAYEDRCAHLGVRFTRGSLEGGLLRCGAHHYEYDACTGAGVNPKGACLRRFPVRIEAGVIWVDVECPGGEGLSP